MHGLHHGVVDFRQVQEADLEYAAAVPRNDPPVEGAVGAAG